MSEQQSLDDKIIRQIEVCLITSKKLDILIIDFC
jgi:hypothetical protein